jgi:thiol-disulfide isomerase/thioredoxin
MKKNLISIGILGLSIVGLASAIGLKTAQAGFWPTATEKSGNQIAGAMSSGRLSKELQGKPVLVDIYADWCGGCQSIKPTLSTLKKQYSGKVNFVVFNVTDRGTSAAAQAKAQQLGLSEFFSANKSRTATVAIINPSTGKVLKVYQANPTLADYTAVLNSAIASIR